MLKKKAEKGARNDGRINLLHGMEKRIKPKIQRGCLNERVKRIEFSLPFFFFFNIFPSQFVENDFPWKIWGSSKYSARSPGQKLRDRIRNTWNHLSKRNKNADR